MTNFINNQCLYSTLSRSGFISGSTISRNTWDFSIRSFASKKHKNILKHCKGFRGRAKNCFRLAIRRLQKSWQYAYRDRRRKRREWRKLWIQKIQAGVRQYNWRYSRFIHYMGKSNIILNRKILSDLAAHEPFTMKAVIDTVEAIVAQKEANKAIAQ